jgi:phage shock protein PspC (stress-responsive transcriptional regulator)
MSSIWTIRRSATDRKIAGVCGGVARHWGVDPVLVRVGAVLLALSGGVGLVLYVAGWLLIPLEGRERSVLDDTLGPSAQKWPKEAWVAVVAVACLLSFAVFGLSTPFGLAAVVLALIWYFGYYKNRSPKSASPRGPGRTSADTSAPPAVGPYNASPQPFQYPGPPTPFTEAADVWRVRLEEVARQGSGSPPAATPQPAAFSPSTTVPAYPLYADAPATSDARLRDPAAPEDPSVQEREAFLANPDPVGLYSERVPATAQPTPRALLARSRTARRLRLVAVLALGLTLAGLGIADVNGATFGVAVYLGAALLVVGLALVAATWFGRARGMLAVGLILLVALLSVTVVDTTERSGGWSKTLRYTSLASLPAGGDQQDIGELTVDLTQLEMPRSGTYTARVDAGRLEVLAPSGVDVRVLYSIDAGVLLENGEAVRSGTEFDGILEPVQPQAGRPTLTLDLSVDVGEVRVIR